MNIKLLILLSLVPVTALLKAQTNASPDELFKAARNAAFDEKDNGKAKQLAKQALLQAPQYAEIEVFLGRLYTWNKQYDTAIYYYRHVLAYAPANEEASIAYADVEYWKENYSKALEICNEGLYASPASADLLLRKAKILNALKQYKEASVITDQLLNTNRHNTAALALSSALKDAVAVNKIGISYDYSRFDKQLSQQWHLASIAYTRQTKLGSFSANVNYANRFGNNGWQCEVDAYPRISKTFYGYVSDGYSPGESVFPKYRAGFSLYANLPHSYEAEAGIRYLRFANSTYVYTLYVGKYYSNFLFGARSYFTPGAAGSSQSYSMLCRYYFKGADDYIGISLGSGISPDDRAASVQYNNKTRLSSTKADVSFSHRIAKMNIISLRAGWLHQQYISDIAGNQVDLGVALQRRF